MINTMPLFLPDEETSDADNSRLGGTTIIPSAYDVNDHVTEAIVPVDVSRTRTEVVRPGNFASSQEPPQQQKVVIIVLQQSEKTPLIVPFSPTGGATTVGENGTIAYSYGCGGTSAAPASPADAPVLQSTEEFHQTVTRWLLLVLLIVILMM